MARPPFVITEKGTIHDVRLATERCNLDDAGPIVRIGGVKLLRLYGKIGHMCQHCWPDEVE